MDANKHQVAADLRNAAQRCVERQNKDWWCSSITSVAAFNAAESFLTPVECDLKTPEEAAMYLLFVAEAIQ